MNIEQKPSANLLATGSEIIFSVKDNSVITNVKGKYIAEVYIGNDGATLTTGNPTCVLKVNPNSHGIGIFDFGSIFDNYVSPDYEGGDAMSTNSTWKSKYKGVNYSFDYPHTIHMVDEFATNKNSVRYFAINFYVEYALSFTQVVLEDRTNQTMSERYIMFNGYLDNTDILFQSNGGFSYNFELNNFTLKDDDSKFLTNAPTKQYVRLNDFMTIPFFNNLTVSNSSFEMAPSGGLPCVSSLLFTFYYNGSQTGTISAQSNTVTDGGFYDITMDSNGHIVFGGIGPANLANDSVPIPANWDYYTVQARDSGGNFISKTYEFYQQYDDCKGFETIRLTWLNKWGTWDYYNFTKKSTRTINKSPVTYHQLGGTWNDPKYSIKGYKGGKRILNNGANEEITINSDYITEAEAIWLEELFVSTDVFILNENSTDTSIGTVKKYIEPVIVKSTTHIRKTQANDNLIQYSIDLEKAKTKRTHRV
tara:strand:+ start:9561 stop:10991 length:1431 start_codon:yes stop_codon:yes gene_type:complete